MSSSVKKSFDKYTIAELKEMLDEAGIPTTGLKLKADFIKKLSEKKSERGRTPSRRSIPTSAPTPETSSSKKVDYSVIWKKFMNAMNRGDSKTKLEKILMDLSTGDRINVVQFVDPNDGSTLLHWAVRYNRDDAATFLLDNGANIEAVAKDGGTPLHWGAYDKNDGDAVELLIARGANLEARNKEEKTPLQVALTPSKYNDTYKSYKRGKDDHGNNNLFQFEVAEILLKGGAKTEPMKFSEDMNFKESILHHFIDYSFVNKFQYIEVAKLLINYDTDKTNLEKIYHSMTPLMEAAESNNIEIVQMLLDKGVDVNKAIKQHTAYDFAINNANVPICKLLIKYKATPTIKFVDQLEINEYIDRERRKKMVQGLMNANLIRKFERFALITNQEDLKNLCDRNQEDDGTYTCAITGEPLEPNESIAIQTMSGASQCYKKENLLRWINRDVRPTIDPLTNLPFSEEELKDLRQKLTQTLGGKSKKKTIKTVTTNTKAKIQTKLKRT